MNAALLYRSRGRSLIWIAFGCAVAIHLAAIGFGASKSKPEVVGFTPDSLDPPVVDIEGNPLPQEQEVIQQEPPIVSNESEFSNEIATPRPIRPRKKPVMPITRSIGTGTNAGHSGSVKALTLYAPRPNYPYEARRGGIRGSGVARLAVTSATGYVVEVGMSQSTGNGILDKATVETLRRWRFKPGVAENVDVPITYTLTGVSY